MSSARSASPGTSTPSQNDAVPSRIALARRRESGRAARRATRRRARAAASALARPRRAARAAIARTSRWLVNSTNIPPSAAVARSSVDARDARAKCPAASTFGAGMSRRHGEHRLLAIVERRRIDAGARLELRIVEPEPRREKVEASVGRERRAGDDVVVDALEQILAQNRREIERHASTRSTCSLAPAHLDPAHRRRRLARRIERAAQPVARRSAAGASRARISFEQRHDRLVAALVALSKRSRTSCSPSREHLDLAQQCRRARRAARARQIGCSANSVGEAQRPARRSPARNDVEQIEQQCRSCRAPRAPRARAATCTRSRLAVLSRSSAHDEPRDQRRRAVPCRAGRGGRTAAAASAARPSRPRCAAAASSR